MPEDVNCCSAMTVVSQACQPTAFPAPASPHSSVFCPVNLSEAPSRCLYKSRMPFSLPVPYQSVSPSQLWPLFQEVFQEHRGPLSPMVIGSQGYILLTAIMCCGPSEHLICMTGFYMCIIINLFNKPLMITPSQFTDEETKAQGDQEVSPRPQS